MSKKNPPNKTVLEQPGELANKKALTTGYGFGSPVVGNTLENDVAIEEDVVEESQEEPSISEEDYRKIIIGLKGIIMPLLENLRDTSDKSDTIHWPNRKKEISAQIRKIERLTKGIE